jgi:foldase protein PrsA
VAQGEPTPKASSSDEPLAYIDGEAVALDQLAQPLLEAAGGRVLAERIISRRVAARLAEREIELTDKQIEQERQRVLAAMSGDANAGTVLLRRMRRREGLGDARFEALLRRNAGLRALVQDEVQITDQAVRRAYQREHGPRYQGRILVVETARRARALKEKLAAGAAFADLAAEHSTDRSARQGGLLSPISPAEASYPQIIRKTLTELDPGEVSDVISLSGGYGLLQLERRIEGDEVKLAEVEPALRRQVRRRAETMRMRQLARSMLAQADVVVLNPALDQSWQAHKRRLLDNAAPNGR